MKLILPIHYNIEYKTKKDKKVLVGLNWYRNCHHHLSNKVKQYYHSLVKEQVTANDKFDTIKPHYNVYLWNKLTDWPNVRAIMEKFVLDGLVEAWVIVNDTVDIVLWDSSSYFIDKVNPRIEIEI